MRRSSSLPVAVFLLFAGTAHAQDAFEIQVYDAETAPPGTGGFEFHANHFAVGEMASQPPELPTDRVTHLTLEPHIGVTRWSEAGVYIQTAIRGDGTFDFGGLKVRFKARVPRRLARGLIGLAANFELANIPEQYEASRYGIEVRPIIDVRWKRLYASFNPMLGIDLTGSDAGRPHFEPAAKISVDILPWLAIGPEYYGGLGRIDSPSPLAQQVHRIFGTLDFAPKQWGPVRLDANVGVGYGLAAGEKWIVKAIIAMDFGN